MKLEGTQLHCEDFNLMVLLAISTRESFLEVQDLKIYASLFFVQWSKVPEHLDFTQVPM